VANILANHVASQAQIKMAHVIIKLKVMASSPEVDMDSLNKNINETITNYGGKVGEIVIEPVAFGLKASIATFSMDESKGSTDKLEGQITEIDGVQSAEVIGVSRALG